jgi:tellurite resistance protein
MIDKKQKEMAAYQAGPFDDLKVQEALTIVAVYAARMDYQNCEADVRRLAEIFDSHPMFVARKKEIFSLINKYVNAMEAGDPHKALDRAADALTQDQKNAAFKLAVEVAEPEKHITADEKKIFDTLKARLSISNEFAEQALSR